MSDVEQLENATDGRSPLTDGLGYLEAYKIFGNVQAQLNGIGQADLSAVLEKAITLIKSEAAAAVYYLNSAQIITSAGCDFDNKVWSFEIDENTKVTAGKYAVIKMPPNAKLRWPHDAAEQNQ